MSNFNWDSFFCVIFAYSYKHDKIVKKERMMMVKRCSWVDEKSEIYKNYHDHEWGKPVYDDEKLYKNMVAARADWLYGLEEWNDILSEDKRKVLYKEEKLSGTVVKEKKVGRNDPCPCGSGKKYKYCCGR